MKLRTVTRRELKARATIALDRLRGLDFLSPMTPADAGLDPLRANTCNPSGNRFLQALLADFAVTAQDAILDIGCGKGSAMRTMLRFPFRRVDGLDVSEKLAAIARSNFDRLGVERTTIVLGDAADFTGYDRYNLVYLYNPFKAVVMAPVVDALIASLDRADRELVMIYNNATCHDVVIERGVFRRAGFYPGDWDNPISIYTNRPGAQSRLAANRHMQLRAPVAAGP